MKKKKIIRLIILVLVIVAILGIILYTKRNKTTHKLAEIYNKLSNGQSYIFEMKKNDKNKIIMAQKDDRTMVDQYSDDNHLTTIEKDNYTYLVLHNREEYYVYGQYNINQNILTDGLKEVVEKKFETGTEKIKGKKYSYEEYSGSTMFIITNDIDISEDNIKTRFFFDNNGNLVYIKTMSANNQELLQINYTEEVEDSIFDIPSHYAEY